MNVFQALDSMEEALNDAEEDAEEDEWRRTLRAAADSAEAAEGADPEDMRRFFKVGWVEDVQTSHAGAAGRLSTHFGWSLHDCARDRLGADTGPSPVSPDPYRVGHGVGVGRRPDGVHGAGGARPGRYRGLAGLA